MALKCPVASRRIKSPIANTGEMLIRIVVQFILISGVTSCDPGYFRTADACLPCAPGAYFYDPVALLLDDGPDECYSCMSGTFSSARGSTACESCTAGAFTNTSGLSGCVPCPQGSFQYADGASACIACPPGTHQAVQGSTACIDCAPGSAQAGEGSHECPACSPGSFAWTKRALTCVECGPGSHQPSDGATGLSLIHI